MGRPRFALDRGLLALIHVLAFAAACAFSTTLAPPAAQRAAREGARMADRHESYAVKPWVLYESRDPLRATHGRADVDAVVVETPYERVRYEAYLYRIQGLRVTPAFVERLRREASGHVGFLVYAHSKTELDQPFLSKFSRATIVPAAGAAAVSEPPVIFGPSSDFYDVGDFREERFVGSITYRFAPRACVTKGRLEFRDAYRRTYAFGFDLTRYR